MTVKSFNQKGSSLIEILVAFFVLAVGLLGVLAIQANAIKSNKNSSLYSVANAQAMDVYEAMRSNPSVADEFIGDFDFKPDDEGNLPSAGTDCKATECTPEQMAEWSLIQWQNDVTMALPGATGAIEQIDAADGTYRIRIRFLTGYDSDGKATYSGKDGADDEAFEVIALEVAL